MLISWAYLRCYLQAWANKAGGAGEFGLAERVGIKPILSAGRMIVIGESPSGSQRVWEPAKS